MAGLPNILYLNSHDTGRYVQPYGYAVPTPNIQRLADQGLLFRKAFAAAPICSGSRASLLTGQFAHSSGMLGLAHRGYRLADPHQHIVHVLREAGYWSASIGEQHVSADPATIGYDRNVEIDSSRARHVAPAAVELIAERANADEPFFMSVGFFETHREFFEPSSVRDALYSLPPANVPDSPETRRDMAAFKASARSLDQGVGAVLNALDEHETEEDTLVILTTDHGLAFPGAKATLYDRGTGVMLIMRGPGGFTGGRVLDAMVSHLDLYPTICDLSQIAHPEWLRGHSLLPLVQREAVEINDSLFSEMTFHAAYEPQRAVRTRRYKYIRRFDNGHAGQVMPNVDDGLTKDFLVEHGWAKQAVEPEQLFDLILDPAEAVNLIDRPECGEVADELRSQLDRWMIETEDPLLDGPIAPKPGTVYNKPDQISAEEPTFHAPER
ncbi:MAG: sulfatase [Solirubrobacterales bacterium]